MATHHVPKPGERPDVEVCVDGGWCPGELRMWTQDDHGAWFAQVQYRHLERLLLPIRCLWTTAVRRPD